MADERAARKMALAASPQLRDALVALEGRIEGAFREMDTDGDGSLSVRELQQGLERLVDHGVSRKEIRDMLTIGGGPDAQLSWKAFQAVLGRLAKSRNFARRIAGDLAPQLGSLSSRELTATFNEMDTNGDGVLSRQELLDGLRSHGIKLPKPAVQELMAVLDTDGDGAIDQREFLEFFELATNDEDDYTEQRKAKIATAKFKEYNVMDDAQLRDACWAANLDDRGTKMTLIERMMDDAMDENPPAQNWADGQSFDREALLNQQVLVRGHGMGTITDVSVPWSYGAAEHTIQFVEGHQLKLTLLSQENQGRNDCIAFKLARADVASPRKADILSHFQPEPGQVLRVRKTAQGFGVIIGLKGAVLSVTTAHARTAGFEQGQVIAAVNGQRVASKQQILEALTWVSLNQEVIFRVVPNDVGSPRKATLGRSPGLQPSSPRGSIRASPRTPDDVLEVDLWGDAQEELQPEPELAYDLQPQPEPQEWNLARGVSVAPNGEEWGSGAKLSDEELMGRRVRVNGHGEGRITNVVVRWGARKYTVQLDRGPVHQVALRTKEGGDKGTQFEVELNAQERRQARAEQRTRVFAQQLAGEIREVLLNESTNLKTLFTQWDTDGDGVLTKAELWEGITALTGKKINRSRLKDLMSIMDADDDGEISLDEFVKIFRAQATAASVAKRVAHRLKQQLNMRGKDLNEAFAKFDTDGDKVLSRAELVSGLRSVGIKLTKKDERDLMSVLDEDGDGEINYAEFVEMATLDEEDLEQRRKAREVKRQHEQFSRKDLATLQQLCWESGMDDSRSHQQLAAQLARNHFFVGTSQWAPGESLSDDLVAEAATNLEVRVLVKGRGYGRLLSVEKGYFSSNNHTVLLDKNQEQIRLQLRTKENASGNATYFKWQRPHSGTDEAQLQNAQEMWDNGKATMELRERAGEAQRRHADAEQATIAAAQAAADSQTAISKQQEQEEEAMRQEAQAKQAQLQRRLAEKEAEEQRIREEARQRARAEGWLQRKQMLNGVAVRMGSAAKAAAGACAALVLACVLAMDSSYLYRLVHGPRTVDALTLEGVQRALIRTIVYGCILVIIADRLPAALKSTRLRSYDVGLLLLLLVLQLLQWLSCTAYLSEPRWPWLDWVRADCVQDLQGILSRPAGRVPLLAAKHTLLLRLGMRTATLPWRRLSPATLTSRRGFQMLGAAIAALIIQGAVVWLLVTSADEQALSSNLIMWLCFTLLPQWLALNAALVYGVLVVLTLELVRSQYNLQAQRVVAVVSAGMSLLGAAVPMLWLAVAAVRTEGPDRVQSLQGLLETGLEAGLECQAYKATRDALWWTGLSILIVESMRYLHKHRRRDEPVDALCCIVVLLAWLGSVAAPRALPADLPLHFIHMGMGWLRVLYRGRHELLWQMDGLVPVRKPRHVRWSRSTLLSHYNAMPLPQLKKECGDYWLEKDGLKQDLVERLVEYRAAKEGMQASVPTLEQAQKARDEVLIATLGLSPWGTGFEAPARECVWVRVADFTAKGREGTDALLGLAGGSEGRRVRIASLGSGRVAGVQKSWLNWALGGPYLQHRLQLDVSDGGTLKTIPLATSDNNGRGISCQVEQAASVTAAQRRKARTRRLAQLAETYLGDALEQQGTSLRRAFEEMDVHGDHKLSLKELQKCLLDVTGRTLRRADLRELVASVDESGDNTVDWQEFVQVFRRAEHARKLASSVSSRLAQISVAQRGNLLPLFESFDTNRDGILTQDELLRGLRGVGIRLRDTQMAEIMSVIDGDGSGGIDYSEFVTAVNDAGRVRNKFAEMPRNELERACREHSLTSSGTNQALVERLVQAELIATRRHTAAVSGASGTEIIWVNGLQWTDDEIVGQRIRLNEARNESGLVQEFKKGWLSNSHVVKWEDSRLSQEVELRTKQNATSGRYFELARQGVAASQKLHEDRGTKLFRLCSANMRTTLIARLEELELALRRGDAAGTGRLTPRQCQNVLHDVAGSGLGFRELKELMATVDEFGDDEVDWKQFLAVVKRARRSQRQVGTSLLQRFRDELVSRGDDLEKTFRDFDTDGDGALDAGELLDGLKQLGVTPTRSEVAELMAVADEDEDNTIDYYEFITLLKGPAHSGSSALSTDSSQRAIQQEQLKSELMKSSLSQLRQKCEDQGLTTDGLKNNLVARLIQSPRESANSATQSPRVRRARARRLIHVVAAEIGQQMKSGESLEDVFVAMDKDGNGKLSTSELQAGIRKMTGRTIGKQGLQDLVQLVDDNENNSVDWKEFVTLYKTAERDQIDATEVMRRARTKLRERGLSCREAFEGFDADDNGKIDREELRVGLRKLGVSLGDEQLKGLMSVVDKNSDGAVDLDEFVAIMQGNGGASEFVKSGSARRRYATMDLADLARECRHRGVPDDGLKADLIARLMKWQDSADDGYYDISTGEVDNSAGSSPDMTNTIWVDGATVSGKDLAPTRPGDVGCTIDVEGYGRGSVLEFQNNRIRRVYRHVVKMFATGEVHTLSLRTGDNPRGGNIDFRLAQGETHSQQRHRGGAPQICEIQKAPPPTNFGMVISATGIVDRHTGRNARDAGVPLRGMITHVNGHSVNGKGDIVAAIRGVEVGERVRFQIETALGDWVPGETEYDANLLDRRIDILGKGIGRVRQVKPSRFGTRTPTEHTVDLEGRGPGGGGGQRIKVSLRSSENAALDRECKTTKRFLIQLTVSETNTRQATKRARRVAENVTPRERESLIRCSLSLEERMRNHSAEERLVDFDAFSGILSGITKRSVSVARLEQSFGEAVMANMQGSDEQEPLFDWMEFCAIFCRAYRGQRLAALLQTHHGDTLKRRETELQEMCESAVTIPGANWLQWEDLRRVLGHFGVKPTKPELEQLSTTVDVDGKLPIDFHELLKAIGGRGFGESSGAMTPREQRARLEGMQLQDLKAECRRYGLQDAGLRSELISRLVAAVGQSTTGQDGTGIGEDHDDDDEADVVWLPGETFPADDLAGRHVHVRGFGRGQVVEMTEGLMKGTEHRVRLTNGKIETLKLRYAGVRNSSQRVQFKVEQDPLQARRAKRAARARRLTQLVIEDMRRAMEIKELTLDEVFGRMDTNGDGVLSADEFAEGLKILTGKQELDGARLRAVMRELDEDGDDEIDIAEFTKIFRRTETARQLATKVAETFRKVLVHRGGMQQAFEEFDKDKNGTISQQELLQGLRKLGARHISESELMECVAVMDMDGNNEIDYQEFVRACAAAEQTARQKELRERYNTAPLHRLKALCKEQELDSTGLRTELIARLLLAGAEEDESLWDGREPDLEKWQTGADVPDVELEGQQVSIQGMGTGRIIEVEAGGLWAASRHRVELINGDTFNVQLRSKNNRNQSRATAFYVRRDATAVTQAKRRRAMLRLVSPELLRALSKHARGGLGLERALEALDSEGEGALDRNVFLRKVLEAAGGGRFLSADAMHHALASPAALRATEFGGAGSRGLVDYHEFCAALRQLEAQRELAAMIGRAGGVPDDELLPKLISGAGLSNTRGGTMVVGQKDLIQASRSLGITPKLSLSQEAELIELLRASQGLTGARANEFALRSFAQDVRAARVLARREDDAKLLGEALRDRFLVELEEFEEHDGDVVGVLADLDADDDGLLTQEQLLGGVRQLGIRLSAMERRDLAGLMDEDGDGLVDFRELAQHLITTHAPSESRGTAPWGRRRGQLADRPSARAALLLRSAARVPVLWKLLLDNEHELRAACAKLDDGGAAAGCLSRGAFERALLGLEGLGSQHRMHDVIALLDDAAALEKALRQVSSEPGGSDATPAELAKRMFRVTGRRVDQGWVRAALPLLAAGDGAADVDWREFCDGLALLGRTTRLADVLLASFGTRVPSDKDVLRRAFADFDSDSSGTIALGDALVGLWELGLKMRRTDAVAALRSGHSFGRAGDNDRIGWEELVRLLHNRSGGKRVHRSLSAPRLRRQHGDDDHDSANDDEYSSLSQLQIMNQRQRQSSARASGGWSPVRGRSSMREGVARLRSSSVAPPLTEWFDVNTSRSPRSSRVRARRYDTNDTSSSDDSSGDEGFDDVSEYDDRHRSRDRGTSGVRHRSRSRGNTRSPSPRHSERFAQRDRRRSPSRSALRRSSPQPSFSLSPVRRDRAPSAPRPDQLQLAPWLHEATPPPSTRRTRRSSSPARSGSRYAAPDSRVSPGSARVQCALDGNHWMVRAAQREEHYCDECAAAGLTTLGTAWSCADGCDYDLCADCHATLAAPPPPPAGSGHRRRRPQASAGDSTRTISAS